MSAPLETNDVARPPNAGGQYLPSMSGRIGAGYMLRYFVAERFAKDKLVLDVASGGGYGSAILGRVARRVTAMERSEAAVLHAQQQYAGFGNVEFKVGEIRELPFPDETFDLVTWFGTDGQAPDAEQAVQELRRVLKDDGMLLISTPSPEASSRAISDQNPCLTSELDHQRLENLLRQSFPHVRMFGQTSASASAMAPLTAGTSIVLDSTSASLRFAHIDSVSGREWARPIRPTEFLAVCSSYAPTADIEIPCAAIAAANEGEEEALMGRILNAPEINTGILAAFLELLTEARIARNGHSSPGKSQDGISGAEISASERELGILKRVLTNLMQEHGRTVEQLERSEQKAASLSQALETNEQERMLLSERLRTIEASTSWRALGRVRGTFSRMPWLRKIVRKTALFFSSAGELK
ncbi:class I SAM-dependent methyltransferase [Microvirga sp. BT688]|uniref:class I SAM-dependent methyltransferase n=1 Tax=Microvirga sp. TaxID=1873136 RepID=UPI0016834940|nr:class I SAM-dependent methyltransferase [Microvirga sp.]MBD2750007.1 class I SAM-dependent methyltransferase [Microvirga sp.]